MLNSLLQKAVKLSATRESTDYTTEPIAMLEFTITPAQRQELDLVAQQWWELAKRGDNNYPKVGGVVVYDQLKKVYMVFVGNYQISVVINDTTMMRLEQDGKKQYPPSTFAKIVVVDYSLHPQRLHEYHLNPETWSIVQYTTGVGLAYLVAMYRKQGESQPVQSGPPVNPSQVMPPVSP